MITEPAGAEPSSIVDELANALRAGTVLDLGGARIPAVLIRDMLLSKPVREREDLVVASTDIDPRGLRITNALITGRLDLDHADICTAVGITDSQFPEGLTMKYALLNHGLDLQSSSLLFLDMEGAKIAGQLIMRGSNLNCDPDGDSLVGDRLQVDGAMYLDHGFTAAGTIRLPDAKVAGALSMTGARLNGSNEDGRSFIGDRLAVKSNVSLNGGFSAHGSVRLSGAYVTGMLSMTHAHLNGTKENGCSLHCDGLQVDSDVSLDSGFTSAGAVRLHGARIAGQLLMRGAHITGHSPDNYSLAGDGLQVDSDVFLDDGFTSAGAVRLPGAKITGILSMKGADLNGCDDEGYSLAGDGLQVDSDVFLDDGFTITGTIGLRGARLGGLRIAAKAVPTGTDTKAGLILAGAVVGDLQLDLVGVNWFGGSPVKPDKDQNNLPEPRVMVSLENCTYSHRPPGKVGTWLQLLRFHTPSYEPRSYQQLASVHRATGHDRDAGRILMAQQDHRRAVLRPSPQASNWSRINLGLSRAGLAIWKFTLGYGYRPGRALLCLAVLLFAAGLMVTVAAQRPADPAIPDVPIAYRPANPETATPIGYCSPGEVAGLAVRIAIPLIANLSQGACIIDTTSTWGSSIVLVSIPLQSFAWILGGLTVAAAATAIKRSN